MRHETPIARSQSLGVSLDLAAVFAAMAGVTAVTLDISLTTTAVPAIAKALELSAVSAIWVVNVYFITVVAALLPLAALGEIYGQRRIFVGGLAGFAVGALICAAAPNLAALVIGRAVVGLSAAAVSSTAPALVRQIYPAARLGRGLGLYALVVGIAFTCGPTVTSGVLAAASWPWLYVVLSLIAFLACGLSWRHLPRVAGKARAFDAVAALCCAVGLGAVLLAIAGVGRLPWAMVLGALGLGVGLTVFVLRREAGSPAPLLAADLFARPIFALSSATSACSFLIQGLIFVVLPFMLQGDLGFTQVEAGLLITPWPATLALMTLIAAPLADRVAPGVLGGIGLILLAVGLYLLIDLPPDVGVFAIVWRLTLCGVGFGFFQSPNMLAIMRAAPAARSGGAGGVLAASRLFGQSLGAAVVAICLAAFGAAGMEMALWVAVGVAVLGAGFSLARLLPALQRASQV